LNLLDLSEVYLAPTYWGPQIVGGLLLGAGFVIGGYCPGTSVAAAATGRIDGLVCALGIGAGTLTFAALFPRLEGFYLSGSAGEVTLPQLLNAPAGLVALGLAVMAIAAFNAASRIARRFAASSDREQEEVS
jgi:uncharacterized membrane protein YedE/YeeE